MIRSSKYFLVLIALLGLLVTPALASAQSASATLKLGVVDMARVINETNEGKTAKTRLEREMNRRQTELDRKQTEFERFATELQSSFDMLSDDAKATRMQSYQEKAMELQQLYANHQQELARAEAEATSKIVERVIAVVRDIATRGNYTMILDSAAIIYSGSGTDITTQVITAYNDKHK